MEAYVGFLEEQTQRPFSEERFQKVCSRSFEAITLWKEILGLSRQRPAPFAAFDAFIHMAPIVTLRGLAGQSDITENSRGSWMKGSRRG